jgi:hypothetical protein
MAIGHCQGPRSGLTAQAGQRRLGLRTQAPRIGRTAVAVHKPVDRVRAHEQQRAIAPREPARQDKRVE